MAQQGVVKFFNNEKQFGFISSKEDGKDIFVHSSGLIDDIREGDQVEYEIGEGKKGPCAIEVRVVS